MHWDKKHENFYSQTNSWRHQALHTINRPILHLNSLSLIYYKQFSFLCLLLWLCNTLCAIDVFRLRLHASDAAIGLVYHFNFHFRSGFFTFILKASIFNVECSSCIQFKLCSMNWSELWNQATEFSIEIYYYFINDDKWKIEIGIM